MAGTHPTNPTISSGITLDPGLIHGPIVINPPPIIITNPLPVIVTNPPGSTTPAPTVTTSPKFVVQGTVLRADGSALSNYFIKVVDVNIRDEKALGNATTAVNGAYSITYGPEVFSAGAKQLADVKVYVYQNSTATTLVASSTVIWNAPSPCTINIVVGGDVVQGSSEYDLLDAAIMPFLTSTTPQLDPANLVEDSDHQDITFLAAQTGQDPQRIKFYSSAHDAQKTTSLDPDVFYGLYRGGLATDLQVLLSQNPAILQQALNGAIISNIIRTRTDDQVTSILASLAQAGVAKSIPGPNSTTTTPLASLLGGVTPNAGVFLKTFANFSGDTPEAFWSTVQTQPEIKDKVPDLQSTIQFGILTFSHAPLVQELQRQKQAGTLTGFADVAKFNQQAWVGLLRKPSIGVPPETPGANADEQIHNFASSITRMVEDTFPAKFFSNRMAEPEDDTLGTLPSKPDVLQFFKQNPDFDFTTTRLPQHLAKNPNALQGITKPDDVKSIISAIQRLYSVAPQYTQTRSLVANGVHSSMQISRMGQTSFVARFSSLLGNESEALKIFDRAEQTHAMSFNLIANFGWGNSRIQFPVFTEPAIKSAAVSGGIPDISTLFGSLDLCSCDECRSVDGPAAYYVDILHFLSDRRLLDMNASTTDADQNITKAVFKTRTDPVTGAVAEMSVKDVLFERRPDLGDVELTCQNTNTPVPYIDLALEVLENAINPLPTYTTSFPSPPDPAISALDGGQAGSIKSYFNPVLSDLAVVKVMKKGEWWTVDEPAYTYTIRKVDSTVKVTARSLQTTGTAAERAANPQYMNGAAYDLVRTQVYPWTSPFDLWIETVRTYLSHISIQRYQIMEAFSSSIRDVTLARNDIACEYLGISSFEASIITSVLSGQPNSSTTGIWNLWGFESETLSAAQGIPDPADKGSMIVSGLWSSVLSSRVDILLRQSGLTYSELLNILEIGSIFGGTSPMIMAAIAGAPVDTCDLTLIALQGAGPDVYHNICRFVRLLRKLDGWSILDLGQAFITFGVSPTQSSVANLLISLSHIGRLKTILDLPYSVILTFWSSLSTIAYTDHENDDEDVEPQSFFAHVYCNKTVMSQPDLTFTGDPNSLQGKLSEHSSVITAALNVSARDLSSMLAEKRIVADDVLSLDSLSKLYRHSALAAALGLTIQDYISLLTLQSANVFGSTLETLLFVERTQNIENSGFSLTELNYILAHNFTEDSGVSTSDDSLSSFLGGLRAGLQKIALENTFDDDTVDENGDLTKKKLALLNWDVDVIAQVVATLNGTTSYTATTTVTLPRDFVFPEGVRDRISYDPSTLQLTYSRPMTVADKTTLLGITVTDTGFKDAVTQMFNGPRAFLSRNAQTFSQQTFKTPLAAFPSTIQISTALKNKFFFDGSTNTLVVVGVMTEDERQLLVSLANPATDTAYIQSVQTLYSAPDNAVAAAGDAFLTAVDVSNMFDASDNATGPIIPRSRFEILLRKLLPKLKDSLTSQYIIQIVSQTLNIESQIAEPLMKWVQRSGKSADVIILADAFANSRPAQTPTRAAFNDQFQIMTLLGKVAILISKFKLTKVQLNWLFEFRKLTNDPASGWLDLNALPVQKADVNVIDFKGWEKLVALFNLRDSLPLGETVLDSIFTKSRQSPPPPDALNSILTDLCSRTKWNIADVQYLFGPQGLNFTFPTALQDEVVLTKLLTAVDLLRRVGCSAVDGASYAKVDQGEKQARQIIQTVKSKYDQTLWLTVAQPIRNILRDKQRSSLVAYLLSHPKLGVKPIWRNSNDLYAYYLMDIEMGPCQLTSRIKQAISVVQSFVQRCLMNLEPEVAANSSYDVRWTEWKTLKSFRVTSASRQIFEKPENFLDSSLRDDKTPFFKDLESELQQSDMTKDVAETALQNYVEKLDAVSRLEVVSYYHQYEVDATGNVAIDVLHVFARTRGTPALYFYRQRIDSAQWTSWEKVDVDITGDHLIPVMWRQRLHLFWAIFSVKSDKRDVTMPKENEAVLAPDSYWQIQLGWSELKNGKWLAKTISDDFLLCYKTGITSAFDESDTAKLPGKTLLTFKSIGGSDLDWLRIECIQDTISPGLIGYFQFDSAKCSPVAVDTRLDEWRSTIGQYVMPPTGTMIKAMSFVDNQSSTGAHTLYLNTKPFNSDPTMQGYSDLQKQKAEVVVLNKAPGVFNIVFPHQDQQFISDIPPSSNRPFFYQQANKSFFVEPSDYSYWFRPSVILTNPFKVDPGLLDGSIFGRYINKPAVPILVKKFPIANISGPLVSRPTVDIGSGLRNFLDVSPVSTTTTFKALPNVGAFNVGNISNLSNLRLRQNKTTNNLTIRSLTASNINLTRVNTSLTGFRPSPITTLNPDGLTILNPGISISLNPGRLTAFNPGILRPPILSSDLLKNIQQPVIIDTRNLKMPIFSPFLKTKLYKFSVFYHPYIPDFIKALNRDGIDGLLQRPLQLSQNNFFENDYAPNKTHVPGTLPLEEVDFSDGGMSLYNWELFYHIPVLIAEKLSKNQQFEEAQKWYHYIFDPTDTSAIASPKRFWRTKPFFDDEDPSSSTGIQNIFQTLAERGNAAAMSTMADGDLKRLQTLEESVRRWRKDPFNPYLVARTRYTAFQKSVVMKYLDNLIAWGDQLFMGDTIELINEAMQIYMLAANILGERSKDVPVRAIPQVQTYNTLAPLLDDFSNALVQIEELVPPAPSNQLQIVSTKHQIQVATSTMLYFCVPKNDKLLSYWDTVADRLFKIRNCMNLQGIVRELALFEPPIDPALLVKAAASGVDLGSVMSDINAPLPNYRYIHMSGKAMDVCNELKSLGSALLTALEKRDAENLSLLRSTQEMRTLAAARDVKVKQVADATTAWQAVQASKAIVQERSDYYSNIAFMNAWEITHMSMEGAALVLQIIEAATQPVAAAMSLIPDLKIGAPTSIGATWGGQNLTSATAYFGAFLQRSSGILGKTSSMAATMGSFQRRKDDWDLQARLAGKELTQYDQQIAGALIRKAIAENELSNHDLQIRNAKELDDFMRSKISNADLYDWMVGQVSSLYFQTYQMAYDVAKRAERCYFNDLGLSPSKSSFIQFGYWDSLKTGLLAGEQLAHDIRRMDLSYIDLDKREYEISRSVSLAQLDPVALIQLKETSQCFFTIPEALFDLDYPGHYFRRIKTVSLTIPCVVGPYTSLSSTLTLLKSSVRTSSTAINNTYARRDNDTRFIDYYTQADSICTSSAQNDSGLFEVNLHDERYLPFERAGAVTSWRLQLPPSNMCPFDIDSITDVIINIRYTAREAGEPLRSLASTELRQKSLDAVAIAEGQSGLARMFSLRHEFPDAWYRLVRLPATSTTTTGGATTTTTTPAPQPMTLSLIKDRFPFVFRAAKSLTFTRVELFIKIADEFIHTTHSADKLKITFTLDGDPAPVTAPGATVPVDTIGLTEWTGTGILRGAKTLGKDAGSYIIGMSLDGGVAVSSAAVQEVMIVVHYAAKWG